MEWRDELAISPVNLAHVVPMVASGRNVTFNYLGIANLGAGTSGPSLYEQETLRGGGMKTFKNNDGRGFQITFPNGLTLSTQFGWGHYCENFHSGRSIQEEMNKHDWASDDAEIAILKDHQFITKEFEDKGDDVLGRVKFDKWLEAFDFCRSYSSPAKEETGRRCKHDVDGTDCVECYPVDPRRAG